MFILSAQKSISGHSTSVDKKKIILDHIQYSIYLNKEEVIVQCTLNVVNDDITVKS